MDSESPPLANPHEEPSSSRLSNAPGFASVCGFALSLVLLLSYNLFSYTHTRLAVRAATERGSFRIYEHSGFPFTFYYYSVGGYLGFDQFWWSGVAEDAVFALCFSAFTGWLCGQLITRWRARL